MSGMAKWGYWCLKYFIITVREYIWFSLDWEASVQQPWSVLQIWGLWAADPATCCGPNGPPNRGTSNHLLCHFSSQPWGHAGAGQGQSVPLSMPQTLGHSGPWALPWPGLGEAAVPANGVGGSPAAPQRSGVLQTMAAPAPNTSLSKEPCFWIIYTTFRWKYFVFYSVDAFFFIMRPSLKPICVSYCQANIC